MTKAVKLLKPLGLALVIGVAIIAGASLIIAVIIFLLELASREIWLPWWIIAVGAVIYCLFSSYENTQWDTGLKFFFGCFSVMLIILLGGAAAHLLGLF